MDLVRNLIVRLPDEESFQASLSRSEGDFVSLNEATPNAE
jgi:hypothetical protein